MWQDAAIGLAPSAVHTVVARLRRRVGPDVVVTEAGRGYRLGAVEVDEDGYAARSADARTARLAGRTEDAAEGLRAALSMWRGGTAYDGVSDQLVTSERARLTESRVGLTEELCRHLLGQPGTEPAQEAYALAVDLVERYPLREEPYAAAMWRRTGSVARPTRCRPTGCCGPASGASSGSTPARSSRRCTSGCSTRTPCSTRVRAP